MSLSIFLSSPLFEKDDCMDAGGRAPTVGALGDVWSSCRGAGGYFLNKFPSIPLFQRGKTLNDIDYKSRPAQKF